MSHATRLSGQQRRTVRTMYLNAPGSLAATAATSPDTTRIEVDGEHPGTLPLTITVLPRRLKVIVPQESALLG